jgi:hypothetical protein
MGAQTPSAHAHPNRVRIAKNLLASFPVAPDPLRAPWCLTEKAPQVLPFVTLRLVAAVGHTKGPKNFSMLVKLLGRIQRWKWFQDAWRGGFSQRLLEVFAR